MDNEDNSSNVVQESAVAEKMIPQSALDRIIKEKQIAAAEKARREVQQEYEAKQQSQPQINKDEIVNLAVEKMRQEQTKATEEQNQNRLKEEADKTAQSYFSKLNETATKFEDFNEVFEGFNHADFHNTVALVAKMDNAGDLMYELAKNPHKLAAIDKMAKSHVSGAKKMLSQLSSSMQSIDNAKQSVQTAKAPLSRVQSSTVGSDNGKLTIRDLRRQPHLRG